MSDLERDDWGVPVVRGPDVESLAYLQGEATAYDRAWQLELERRRGEGRVAELLGIDHAGWDLMSRRLGIAETAQRAYENLDAETSAWCAAYVEGVRAGLAEGAARDPALSEHDIDPAAWKPWTPLAIFRVAHVLFGAFPQKLWKDRVAQTLGEDGLDVLGIEGGAQSGSNAWVLTGSRTASGSPMIAGDPHRLIEAPGVYQQIRLVAPGIDVVGLTFPGIPGVQHFAHCGTVAWAVTNAMADAEDLVREELRAGPSGGTQARGPSGWEPVQSRVVNIACADRDPISAVAYRTQRGPVLVGGTTPLDGYDDATTALALRTPSEELGDLGFAALLPLLRSRTVSDVESALASWVEPVNSVLIADREGSARRLIAGRVPLRDALTRRSVSGADPEATWKGFATLPANDVDDVAVAANDRRTGDGAELGHDFAPPYRAQRITELLMDRVDLEVEDQTEIHRDVQSYSALILVRLLADGRPNETEDEEQARLSLLSFNGHMQADSMSAGRFAAWRSALVERLCHDPVLAPLAAAPPRWDVDQLFWPWMDLRSRLGAALPSLVARGAEIGIDMHAHALDAVSDLLASSEPARPWGGAHHLAPLHVQPHSPPFAAAPWSNRGLGGDLDCVSACASTPGVSDQCVQGPVARYVWDLDKRSRGGWIVPLGAIGPIEDERASNQLEKWIDGQLIPLPEDSNLSRENVGDIPAHRRGEHTVEGIGSIRLDALDPTRDAGLIAAWSAAERSHFWGMGELSKHEIRDLYQFLDGLATHHAYLVRHAGDPIALLQTYDPSADPLGEVYPVQEGDLGFHLMLAPSGLPKRGFTARLARHLLKLIGGDPRVRRLVAEPAAGNHLALRRLESLGFTIGAKLQLSGKTARLCTLDLTP